MPESRRFIQCDVFTATPTKGNGLAVVVDGAGLSDEQMQQFAAWTNLSETTFLMPPSSDVADYKVRIFTPTLEMPFAGHPTLGSCASWLHTGGKPRQSSLVRQECGVGIVEIDISGETPAFIAPPTSVNPMPEEKIQNVANTFEIDSNKIQRAAILDNGPKWQAFELASADDVLALDSNKADPNDPVPIGFIGPHESDHEADYEVRMFATGAGITEDPITGSLNAALAHWMMSLGTLESSITVAQGTCIGRSGRVTIEPDQASKQIKVGGQSHILIEGTVFL